MTYALWPDGHFCELDELPEMTHRSDDYTLVEVPDDVDPDLALSTEH